MSMSTTVTGSAPSRASRSSSASVKLSSTRSPVRGSIPGEWTPRAGERRAERAGSRRWTTIAPTAASPMRFVTLPTSSRTGRPSTWNRQPIGMPTPGRRYASVKAAIRAGWSAGTTSSAHFIRVAGRCSRGMPASSTSSSLRTSVDPSACTRSSTPSAAASTARRRRSLPASSARAARSWVTSTNVVTAPRSGPAPKGAALVRSHWRSPGLTSPTTRCEIRSPVRIATAAGWSSSGHGVPSSRIMCQGPSESFRPTRCSRARPRIASADWFAYTGRPSPSKMTMPSRRTSNAPRAAGAAPGPAAGWAAAGAAGSRGRRGPEVPGVALDRSHAAAPAR